jgi:hypothetical protein
MFSKRHGLLNNLVLIYYFMLKLQTLTVSSDCSGASSLKF